MSNKPYTNALSGGSRAVKSVETTLDIIETLQTLNKPSLTEIADHLDISNSAVHNHLATLENRGYVVREDDTWRPSLRFLSIGEEIRQNHIELYRCGVEVAHDLARDTGEFCWLMAYEMNSAVCIYKQGGENAVETGSPVGTVFPLHSTASGKAILAAVLDTERDEILHNLNLNSVTDKTITSDDDLRAELEDIQEQGYALADEEELRKVRGVASPITDVDGDVLGSIVITGPVSRLKGERFHEEIPEMVTQAANIIEINVINSRKTSRQIE
jgi:DNA-binding IclR family transcriptional regulator